MKIQTLKVCFLLYYLS